MALLEVEDLRVEFPTRRGALLALDGVSLEINEGEVLGVVGESGAGKSLTGSAIIGLLEPPGRVTGGQIRLEGHRIDDLSYEEMRAIRGKKIGAIFQDPLTSLNPLYTVGRQLVETIRVHLALSPEEARGLAIELLGEVGIPAPERRIDSYPHEFSGGMRQRVAIAIALLNRPELIIADEPTTALDVTIQAQILHEVQKLCRQTGTALIWITHDLAVVAGLADHLCVMYAGRMVETGRVDDVIDRPLHPYTHGLIGSVPSQNRRGRRLTQIPGMTPSLLSLPVGCAFRARCDRADHACRAAPPVTEPLAGRGIRCFHPRLGTPDEAAGEAAGEGAP